MQTKKGSAATFFGARKIWIQKCAIPMKQFSRLHAVEAARDTLG